MLIVLPSCQNGKITDLPADIKLHAAITWCVWDNWMILFFSFPFNLFTQMSSRWMVCVYCAAHLLCASVCTCVSDVLELPSSFVWCGYYNQFNLVLTLRGCRWKSELCYLVIYVFLGLLEIWDDALPEVLHYFNYYLVSWSISLCLVLFILGAVCIFLPLR